MSRPSHYLVNESEGMKTVAFVVLLVVGIGALCGFAWGLKHHDVGVVICTPVIVVQSLWLYIRG